jgi:hypothetical protein
MAAHKQLYVHSKCTTSTRCIKENPFFLGFSIFYSLRLMTGDKGVLTVYQVEFYQNHQQDILLFFSQL